MTISFPIQVQLHTNSFVDNRGPFPFFLPDLRMERVCEYDESRESAFSESTLNTTDLYKVLQYESDKDPSPLGSLTEQFAPRA